QKIGNQGDPELLTLFRVKLGADDIVSADNRRDGSAIVRLRHEIRSAAKLQLIGVNEIGVQAVISSLDAVEQRMRLAQVERIPAHMRNFERGIRRHNAVDFALKPSQPRRQFVFAAAFGQELHADAYTEEW